MADLFVERTEPAPDGGRPGQGSRANATLHELAQDFHLFTLGPVYIGASVDRDMLEIFQKEEDITFNSVTCDQPFPLFRNLKEWDFIVQGIEKTQDLGDYTVDVDTRRATELFSQFMQSQQFVNRATQFYAKIYSRPVVIVPPGEQRGVPVEVYMLMSNKGTHRLQGANPYTVAVVGEINPDVAKEAEVILGIVGDA